MSLIRYRDLSMLYRRRKRMSEWVQSESRKAFLQMTQAVVTRARTELRASAEGGVPFSLGEVERWAIEESAPLQQAAERAWLMGFHDASDSPSPPLPESAKRFAKERSLRLAEVTHSTLVSAYKEALQKGWPRRQALHYASNQLQLIGSLTASGEPEDEMDTELLDAVFMERYTRISAEEYLEMDSSQRADVMNEEIFGRIGDFPADELDFWLDRTAEDAYGALGPWNEAWGERPVDRIRRLERDTGKQLLPLDLSASDSPQPARKWSVMVDNVGRESAVYLLNEGLDRAFRDEGAMVKMWVSTLDERVRWNHELMHGVCVDVDDSFRMPASEGSGFVDVIMKYPGHCASQSEGGCPPGDVYNCRCTMVAGSSCEELQALFDSLRDDQITVAAETTSVITDDSFRPRTLEEWARSGYVPPSDFPFADMPNLTSSDSDKDGPWRAFLRERFPQWSEWRSRPLRQMSALYDYARGRTSHIQRWLRHGERPLNRFERARMAQVLDDVWNLFESSTAPSNFRLWRGMQLGNTGRQWTAEERANPMGAEWTDWGISSTTAMPGVAAEFADPSDPQSVMMELVLPEGFPSIPVSMLQDMFEQDPIRFGLYEEPFQEGEVMLPPGTRFRVVDVKQAEAAASGTESWEVEVSLDPEVLERMQRIEDDIEEGLFSEDSFSDLVYDDLFTIDGEVVESEHSEMLNFVPDRFRDRFGG